ncbi:hypothetical protein Hanom_Chr09g00849061 [Helianthus anomalus]
MQSFFKAVHFSAMQEISASPTVSLPHNANRSSFWQFVANSSKLTRVQSTPISTNS